MEIIEIKKINGKSIIPMLWVYTATLTISSCISSPAEKQQDSSLTLQSPPHQHFQQLNGDELHPAQYFTCGKIDNPCNNHLNHNFFGEK